MSIYMHSDVVSMDNVWFNLPLKDKSLKRKNKVTIFFCIKDDNLCYFFLNFANTPFFQNTS